MTKRNKVTKKLSRLPKVVRTERPPVEDFPLQHYSYSTFVKFSTNPILFKINYINHDPIEHLTNVSSVVGNAFHAAMEAFYTSKASNTPDPVKDGLEAGTAFLAGYEEGFIDYSTAVPTRDKAHADLATVFASYMRDKHFENETVVACEELIEEDVDLEWNGERITLPVKLKGYIDKVVRDKKGRLKIVDYKTTRAFSDPEKIDGAKMLQAVQYFFLVYAKYGEAPYSIIFEEVKISKNKDGSSQLREYEVVYEDSKLFFDFYLRFYEDITRAVNGEAVFVPNIHSFYDNEIAVVSYIHRLDVSEEAAKLKKKLGVSNMTELLKKQIESAGSMRKFLKAAERQFVNSENLNYENMTTEEKIRTKLMTLGIVLQFDSVVSGHNIDLYRFSPTLGLKMSKIEAYSADVEQVLGISGVRILAPIPNSNLVGFEVPKLERTFPTENPNPRDFELAVGVDIYGVTQYFDIRTAPHMLVAGATGSGKSVFLNSMISQLLTIPNTELHLFDPKIVELAHFKSQATEYLTEQEDIALALMELVDEMNRRYQAMAADGVRSIADMPKMPYKFVVLDEYGDLVLGKGKAAKNVNESIQLLAQKARAAGIHLIISTQSPRADIITGSIKANFPTKVAFRMSKAIDSQVLLDHVGAEKLLGKGDMLFSSHHGLNRLQGFNA